MKSTKHEIRSTKQYQNPNVQMTKTFGILNFCHLNLFRISTRQRRVSIGTQRCWVEIRIYSIFVFFPILIAAACLGLCGCAELSGYSNESLFPQKVDSICLEMFDNQTFRRGTEYELSDALSKRIEVETPYKIVSSRDRADTVISGQIVSIAEFALSTERETGRVLEKEVELEALVNWKNLMTGELLIDNQSVTASASYSEYQQQDFKYASSLAANNLARKIVELMERKW
ncbi:MAG: LPS assembly lipoprotein LptE [Planctomycetota bacterium]